MIQELYKEITESQHSQEKLDEKSIKQQGRLNAMGHESGSISASQTQLSSAVLALTSLVISQVRLMRQMSQSLYWSSAKLSMISS